MALAFLVKLVSFRLLAGVLLANPPAAAQDAPTTRQPTAYPTAYPAAAGAAIDTATSLHRLFERQRHANVVTLGIGTGVGVVSYAVAASNATYQQLGVFIVGSAFVVAGVSAVAKGAVGLATHSRARERRIVRAWHEHRLPPRWLRRALRPENIRYAPEPASP